MQLFRAIGVLGLVAMSIVAPGIGPTWAGPSKDRKVVAAPPDQYRIDAIRAYYYYEGTGAFGDQDLSSGEVATFNTTTGGGDADAPSGATLIKIDVVGPKFVTRTKGAVTITARAAGTTLVKTSLPLSTFFSEAGRIVVPVIAYGTGCTPLTITATLEGAGPRTTMTKTVPFRCAE